MAAALRDLGGLDVLVNNAGICIDSTIEKSDESIWDTTLNINLKGTFFCARVAKAIAYLASHDARFITGVALPMDGGISAGT